MPLKTLAMMSAGRPVLAGVEPDCDTARLVERVGCGVVCGAGDVAQFCDSVRSLMSDENARQRMGEAGRIHALEHFGIDRAVESYENLFLEAAREHQRGTAL